MHLLRGLTIALLALLALPALRAQADAPVVPPGAAEQALAANDCQRELPSGPVAGGGAAGSRDANGGQRRPPRQSPADGWHWSVAGSGCFSVPLLVVAVAVAIGFLLVAILRSRQPAARLAVRKTVQGQSAAVADERPPAVAAPLPDHAALAAAGDFGAAVHAVLLHAFVGLAARIGALPRHATGREVLARAQAALPDVASLGGLVRVVERVHFGGAAADREVYRAACEQLGRWEAACRPPS